MKRLSPQTLREKLWKLIHELDAGTADKDNARAIVYAASILIKTAGLKQEPNPLDAGDG
jgi:hypothetical protein